MALVHYIFVRRDLPLGVMAAMVTHAAGESASVYAAEWGDFTGATAVVLEAKDENDLETIATMLRERGIGFNTVHEDGGAYHGQLMAIGVVPGERENLASIMQPFKLLSELDKPEPQFSTPVADLTNIPTEAYVKSTIQ